MTNVALVVGINEYDHFPELFGCVRDAAEVEVRLRTHFDYTENFECNAALPKGRAPHRLDYGTLWNALGQTFSAQSDVTLFYFAGHGHLNHTGGVILTSDAEAGRDGLALSDVIAMAERSPAHSKIIILDSCHAGAAGDLPARENASALIGQGMTILAASTSGQYAEEQDGQGIFTNLLIDALDGAAATLTGEITPGAVYAHIDRSLPNVGQRPVFKTNVQSFVTLRRVKPTMTRQTLKELRDLFPKATDFFPLTPEYEPEMKGRDPGMPDPVPALVAKFLILQQGYRANLVVPVDQPNMWSAAMKYTGCRLTALGRHYWRLVQDRWFG